MPVLLPYLYRRGFDLSTPNSEFLDQWTNPSDIFTALLILGGDGGEMVAKSVAQLAGRGLVPVAFSIGWVVFAVKSALSALAGNDLMPEADSKCIVINGKSGYVQENRSWLVGRLWRDFNRWMDPAVRAHLDAMLERKFDHEKALAERMVPGSGSRVLRRTSVGLCIAVYQAGPTSRSFAGRDLLYYVGFVVCILQLGIAAIPLGIFGDWSIFLVTTSGIILSFTTCSISRWADEKWACRVGTRKSILLSRGNGSQFVILILGEEEGFDLEDLAAGGGSQVTHLTQLQLMVLASLWIVLLITATGIKQHTWFLFAVCAVGVFQNIYVAITWRSPDAYGMPLKFKEVIGLPKVMDTLFEVEERYPSVGLSMRDIFFPGKLSLMEEQRWDSLRAAAK
ncbi:hypothetical protein BDV34DRAFT_201838 [Aspergillus parasiticus]|uniref:Uncharacterized protein n=1 Tax=Aspergillus parasiticus TaxID=5067 RepID=A0A5N6D9Q5_ASPPA|nr:hypothetical protein BDV34DRAFT_201838 [Aspergillus parasiticus]